MQRDMNHLVCPLCKQVTAIEDGTRQPATQLCSGCQAIIQRILPRPVSAASTMVAERPAYAHASPAPPIALEEDYFDAVKEAYNQADFQLIEEPDHPLASHEQDADPEIYMDFQPPDEDETDLRREAYDPLDAQPLPEVGGELAAAFEPENSPAPPEPDSFSAYMVSDAEQPESLIAQHQVESRDKPPDQEQAPRLPDVVTDPWDDPLPTWDYSRNEWPITVSTKQPGALARFRIPLAVFVLLAACAAGYFFTYQEASNEAARSAATEEASGEGANGSPPVEEKSQPPGEAAAAVQPQQAPAAQQAAEQPPATDAAPANELIVAQGPYSLQAASFPDEAAAKEFSEKLAGAGVQAYVVPADIAGRGRWFRVRAGRFFTAEEAQKYAALSRQRARAAGMNIQLIVCDYGKE